MPTRPHPCDATCFPAARRRATVALVDLAHRETGDETALTPAELRRAQRIGEPGQRRYWVAARAALRRLLSRHLRVPAPAIDIARDVRGRPRLDRHRHPGNLDFNLSHCGSIGLIGIAEGHRIGVDVERVRGDTDVSALARRFFARAEADLVAGAPPATGRDLFFRLWTRKEAVLKALGSGLAGGLERVEFRLGANGRLVLHAIDGDTAAASAWLLYAHDRGPLKSAVAVLDGPRA